MILLALHMPTVYWVRLLTPFRGALPSNDVEYRQFLEYVKRFGHLCEAGSHSIQQGVTPYQTVMATFPTWDNPESQQSSYPQGAYPSAGMSSWNGVAENAETYFADDSDTSDDDGDDIYLFENDPDMTAWSHNDVGEYLYQRCKTYKKKWRHHSGKPPRRDHNRRRPFQHRTPSTSKALTRATTARARAEAREKARGEAIPLDEMVSL